MTNVLVTGGAGFVGSTICCELARGNANVTAVDNLHRAGSDLNVPRLASAGVRFIHGDVRLASDWGQVAADVDMIVDCAAEPSVLAGVGDSPAYAIESNLLGTYHCLEHARRYGAGVILISTSRVYPIRKLEDLPFVESATRFDLPPEASGCGVSAQGISEAFPLVGVRSLYGGTKLASEILVEEYAAAYGLRTVVNRCGAITGPRQMGKVEQGVFALWMGAHYFGRPLTYTGYGGFGKQVRDFVHVQDLVDLTRWQVCHLTDIAGATFNIGGGIANSLSLVELTELCQAVTGKTTVIKSDPRTRANDIRWYVSDTAKARQICGWTPKRTTIDIAEDVHQWLKDDATTLAPLFRSIGA